MHIKNIKSSGKYFILLSTLFAFIGFQGHTQTAYITNQFDNNVSVIDVITNTVTSTIPVDSFPFGVAVSQDGARVYISNIGDGTVSVINTSTNSVFATIQVGDLNGGICVSPDGFEVYVSKTTGQLIIINTGSLIISDSITGIYGNGIIVSPDGSKVYLAGSTVSVVETSNHTIIATIPDIYASGISVNPDGSKVYVTNWSDGTVKIISTATNTVIDTVDVGVHPVALCVSPDGSKIYVSNRDGWDVSVIDTLMNNVSVTIDINDKVHGIDISPDGSKVYVIGVLGNAVNVINTITNTVVDTINIGHQPIAFGKFISSYVPVGIATAENLSEAISIFPNPATDVISLIANNNFAVEKLLLYDATGRLVVEKSMNGASSFDISNLIPTLYIYEVRSTKNKSIYGKLLKQ